jgi:transposase
MEAYSVDLRERIVRACDEGSLTRQEIADEFAVSRSFVQKLLRRRRTEGTIAAKAQGGGPDPLLDEADRKRLRKLVKQRNDATLRELATSLKEQGGPQVSITTVWRALRPMDLPVKKKEPARQRAGFAPGQAAASAFPTEGGTDRSAETGRGGRERSRHGHDPPVRPGTPR